MLRVLLLLEDYSELVFLQTFLKKLGFDVEGIQSPRQLDETILNFNPDVVVASQGKRIVGDKLLPPLAKRPSAPRRILLASGGNQNISYPGIDVVLPSPVQAMDFIRTLARLGKLSADTLIEKYRKIKANLSPDDELTARWLQADSETDDQALSIQDAVTEPIEFRPTTMSAPDRRERYAKWVSSMDKPIADGFPRKRIVEFHKKIRADEDSQSDETLELERQHFVKKLFER